MPLQHACSQGRLDIIKLIMKSGQVHSCLHEIILAFILAEL